MDEREAVAEMLPFHLRDEPPPSEGEQREGVVFTETPELVVKRQEQADGEPKRESKWKLLSTHSREANGEPLPDVENSSPAPRSGWSQLQAVVVSSEPAGVVRPGLESNPSTKKLDFAEIVKKVICF